MLEKFEAMHGESPGRPQIIRSIFLHTPKQSGFQWVWVGLFTYTRETVSYIN